MLVLAVIERPLKQISCWMMRPKDVLNATLQKIRHHLNSYSFMGLLELFKEVKPEYTACLSASKISCKLSVGISDMLTYWHCSNVWPGIGSSPQADKYETGKWKYREQKPNLLRRGTRTPGENNSPLPAKASEEVTLSVDQWKAENFLALSPSKLSRTLAKSC